MPFAEDQPRIDHSRITPIVPNSWPRYEGRIGVNVGFTIPGSADGLARAVANVEYYDIQCLGEFAEAADALPECERRAIVRAYTDPDLVSRYEPILMDLGFHYRGLHDADTNECLIVVVDYDCGLALRAFIAAAAVAFQNMVNAGSDEATIRVESPWSEYPRTLRAVLAAAELREVSWRDAENGGTAAVTVSRA